MNEDLRKLLHAAADCHQALLGYAELGEFARAAILAQECQASIGLIYTMLKDLADDKLLNFDQHDS